MKFTETTCPMYLNVVTLRVKDQIFIKGHVAQLLSTQYEDRTRGQVNR